MRTSALTRRRTGPLIWALTLAIVALITAACGGSSSNNFNDPRLREFDNDLTTAGQAHVEPGQLVNYATIPPYGGPHWRNPLPCGIYDNEQHFEPIVHTLEHGAVAIYYQPLVFDAGQVAEFRLLASRLLREGRKIVLAPSTQIGQAIVLASWGRLLALDKFEPETIEAFTSTFEGDGPEEVTC